MNMCWRHSSLEDSQPGIGPWPRAKIRERTRWCVMFKVYPAFSRPPLWSRKPPRPTYTSKALSLSIDWLFLFLSLRSIPSRGLKANTDSRTSCTCTQNFLRTLVRYSRYHIHTVQCNGTFPSNSGQTWQGAPRVSVNLRRVVAQTALPTDL